MIIVGDIIVFYDSLATEFSTERYVAKGVVTKQMSENSYEVTVYLHNSKIRQDDKYRRQVWESEIVNHIKCHQL